MTVARLLNEMTSDELNYWMAYSELQREEAAAENAKNQINNSVRRRR
jgi:hypothetical protein